MYYEVIFEDGTYSVCSGTEDDVLRFANEHQRRAVVGEPGGPAASDSGVRQSGAAAVRVKRILEYTNDPGNYNVDAALSVDVAKTAVGDCIKAATDDNKIVSIWELIRQIRLQILEPFVVAGPHDSNFKNAETRELDPAMWGA